MTGDPSPPRWSLIHEFDNGRVLTGAHCPGVALPLLVVPVLVDPASAVPLPAPAVPVFVGPVSAVPAGVPAGVVSVGVVSVGPVLGPPEDAGLDVGEAGVEELLAGADEDSLALALAVLDGLADDEHCVSLALADVLLAFVFGEAEVAVLVAVEVALAVPVVAVAVPVAVPVVVLSAGLLLVLPVGGLLAEFSAAGLGAADLAGGAAAEADDEVVPHPVAGPAPWPAEVPP